MSTSRLFNVFVALALVVVVSLTVHAGVATSNLVNSGTIDVEGARWTARAEYYARQAQEPARIKRAQEAYTARWVALAKAYEPTENAQSAQPAYDAEAARWVALGKFYGQLRAAQDADTARWVAMGKFYAKLEVERSQRVQEAEAARWQALGEFYAKQAQETLRNLQAQDADAARWTAMAKFYAKLHTKPFFSTNKGQNSTDNTLDQQARDAIQVRWQAEHGGANRTCVLLCGGQ